MKNKKMILFAILIIIFGIVLINVLKSFSTKMSTETYTCELNASQESSIFDITFVKNKASKIKMTTIVTGPIEDPELDDSEKSPERLFFENRVIGIRHIYEAYQNIKNFEVDIEDNNGKFIGELTIDYKKVDFSEIKGLFATENETLENYINRLQYNQYKCEKTSN